MRTVQEIYDAYRVMPSLQLHQLRVAGCAQRIIDSLTADVRADEVLLACLFHDMANIIKSDLSLFPDLLEPEGRAHWQMVKDEFIARYGGSEHAAALAIGKEIGLPHAVLDIIGHIGFSKLDEILSTGSLELQIAEYCDLRVGPHGVLSMQARIDEGTERYRGRHSTIPRAEEVYEKLVASAYALEERVFAEATIAPADITEASVAMLFPALRERAVA
jgi:hypothetical protein